MGSARSIAFVIPALNEQDTIGKVVETVRKFGTAIVVDDGSKDATGERARAAGATVVRHDPNRGYDAAINSGFQKANELGATHVFTFDADGQHTDEALQTALGLVQQNPAALLLGIRPRFQRFSEWVLSLVARARFGITDPLCGLKGYPIEVYRKLGHFDSYESIGTELAFFGASHGWPVVQFRIPMPERAGGIEASRFGWNWRAEKKILRAALKGLVHSFRASPVLF